MNIDFSGMEDQPYIRLKNCFVWTVCKGYYRGLAGNEMVYSPESILEIAYKTGWNGKTGLDAFVDCYCEIIMAYLKQKISETK